MALSPSSASASNGPQPGTGAAGMHMDGLAWLMLLALSCLWGGSFIFVEVLLPALPVSTLVALRVGLAAPTLWLVIVLTGRRVPRAPRVWAAFAVLGLINNVVPFSLIAWGQTGTTAGLAAILTATTPLFTALIAGAALADERLTAGRLCGILLGLAGVAAMIGPAAVLSLGHGVAHQLAIVAAAVSYASSAVFGRRFARLGVPPLMVATGQITASALFAVPVALVLDGPAAFVVADPFLWLAIAANACLSTALAYLLYFSVLARAGATNVALVTVLVPVVAVIAGAVLLGETLGVVQVAGMALIFAGLAAMDGRLWRRVARRHRIRR